MNTFPIDELRELLMLDEASGRLYWRRTGREALTAIGSGGYRHGQIAGRMFKAHRVVFALANGNWPAAQVDHINGDKIDNRPANLREATGAQNSANGGKRPNRHPSSRFIGVVRVRSKWEPIVRHGKKNYRCGRFEDEEEAARARDRMAVALHGEFARLNFPEEHQA